MGGCGGGEERETGGGAESCEPVGDTTAEPFAGEGAEAISFNSFRQFGYLLLLELKNLVEMARQK